MKTLYKAGYDIEWHIVLVGAEKGLNRYKDLAGATGGSFLAVTDSFDMNNSNTKHFLNALASSGKQEDHDRRYKRQRQYELDAKKGKAEQNAKFGNALKANADQTWSDTGHAGRYGMSFKDGSCFGRGHGWIDGLATEILGVLLYQLSIGRHGIVHDRLKG